MADKILNTRIKLRYASYAEWQASTIKLLSGEVAVCYIDANNKEIKNTAPTVLFKVGDGEHAFKDLQWASARAADVYDWAKAAEKPSYTKAEVGLANVRDVEQYSKDEVNKLVEDIRGDLETDTNTTYRFAVDEKNKIVFYSTEKGSSSESQVAAFEVDLSDVERAISNCYTKDEINNKGFLVASDIAGKAEKTYVD